MPNSNVIVIRKGATIRQASLAAILLSIIFFCVTGVNTSRAQEIPLPAAPPTAPKEPNYNSSLEPSIVMPDWTGTPTMFQNAPAPLYFYVEVNPATPDAPAVSTVDWQKALKTFRADIIVDGKDLDPAMIVITPAFTIYHDPTREYLVGRMEISVKGGWPLGNITVEGDFDRTVTQREAGVVVRVTPGYQGQQIRFHCRLQQSPDDELLRLRFEAARLGVTMMYVDGTEKPKQFEAIQRLLKVFPDDLFGHAWLARWYELRALNDSAVALSEIGADEWRQQLVADAQAIILHTRKVYDLLKAAYDGNVPGGFGTFDPNPAPQKDVPNPKFGALRFNAWMGAYGAAAIMEKMVGLNIGAQGIKAAYESPYALRLNQLRDPLPFIASLKQPRTPFAVWMRKRAVDFGWSYFITEVDAQQPNAPVSPKLKNDIVKFANSLLFANPFYKEELFQGVTLSPLSQQFAQVPPKPKVERLKFHRSLLQDAYPGVFSPLEEVKVAEK